MNDKLYKYYFYGFLVILALPVITTPVLFNPTAWGKTIIFRIILAILIFISIYKYNAFRAVATKVLSRKSNVFWPFCLLIGFLGLVILSTIFSLDPNFSFWGSPLRGDGSLNYIFYIIFAILTFLIVKKTDWEKIWKFSISIGVLVSIIALFQKFGVFSKTVRTYDGRPPGTLGGPIFLALYLLLLSFITFSFFLKEKRLIIKIFYLLAFLLFVYIIILTSSRAIWFGLLIGLIYFILTFPRKNKLFLAIKISFLLLILLGAYGIYYINTDSQLLNSITGRLSIKLARDDPRFSAWIVSAEAIKDHPILGYGPENFSIAFDRYYDPSLPFINKEWGSWYDRAHNFIFEMGVTYGIPALLVYLALIGVLFWKLQKIKYGPNTFIIHGIQATFFAYLGANIFSFDVFSTYLIFFLLIAYSLSLICDKPSLSQAYDKLGLSQNPARSISLSLLFIFLLGFIWYAGLKPLYINRDINMADRYARTKKCDEALDLMQSNVIYGSSTIDSYAKLKYISIIERCNARTPKAIELLKRVTEIRPYYTRTYIFLGNYTGNKSYFDKAEELSPKREEIFVGKAKIDLAQKEYSSVLETAQECTKITPRSKYCWWLKIISNFYLDNIKMAILNIKMAKEKDFDFYSKEYLFQIEKACETNDNIDCYNELFEIYKEILPVYNKTDDFEEYKNLLIEFGGLANKSKEVKQYLIKRNYE